MRARNELIPQDTRIVRRSSRSANRVICTFATGRHRELAAYSATASQWYADRWGWDVVVSSERHLAAGRPASWAKVTLMLELLVQYEWVWCIDADALIVDLERDVLAEVDPDDGIVFLAHHTQEHDDSMNVPNAGVVLAASTPQTLALLETVWEQTDFVEHNWWENAALLYVMGYSLQPPYPLVSATDWTPLVGRLDLAWNSVPGYVESPTPALHHHARADHGDFARRVRAMAEDLDAVRRRLAPDLRPERAASR